MFDAYTVKKVFPRLAIAIVLIQLSWPIFTFMIFIVSQVAWGIEGLMYAPFGGRDALDIGPLVGQAVNEGAQGGGGSPEITIGVLLGGAGIIGYGLALGAMGLLSLAVTVLLAVLIAFFVLAVRQVVIVVLLVLSPIALVAWILPNTEKIWKIWWESFSKLLFMYPLILLLIAGGKVAAFIAAEVSAESSTNDGFGMAIVILAWFAPYFLIPATFKLAGSTFANISGVMNDRSKGAFDRLRNFRGNQAKKNWGKIQSGNRFRSGEEGSFRDKLNKGLQAGTMINRAGFRPSRMKENLINAVDGSRWEFGQEAIDKIPGAKAFFANDDGMLAALEGGGDFDATARYLVKEKNYDEAQARLVAGEAIRLRNEMGAQSFGLAAVSRLPATGTAYKGEDGAERWLDDIIKYSGGNKTLMASAVAAGKSGFRSAGQYEISEAGFGDVMKALDMRAGTIKDYTDVETGETYDAGKVATFIHDKAYAATSAQGIVNARNADSGKAFAGAAARSVERAEQATGDKGDALKARAAAKIESIREAQGSGKQVVVESFIDQVAENLPVTRNGETETIYEWADATKRSGGQVGTEYKRAKRDFDLTQEEARKQTGGGQQPGADNNGGQPGQQGPAGGL